MIKVVVGDITTMKVDVIVNAANPALVVGGGVCGAIFKAAGVEKLTDEIQSLYPMGCQTGGAVLTSGGDLPVKWIAHAVGPVYQEERTALNSVLLREAYVNALTRANSAGATSIAFPAISTGIYGYPLEEATAVAVLAINWWLWMNDTADMTVYLVAFNDDVAAVLQAEVDRHPDIGTYGS